MDAATQARYDLMRSNTRWLVGVGALGSAANPFVPVAPVAVPARWLELYGSALTPSMIEWEMGEANQQRATRDWTGLRAFADAGGLPWTRISLNNFTVTWAPGPPIIGGMHDTRGGAAAVLPGGSAYAAFTAYAQQLAQEVKAVGKPVVLRPFHEMNAGWFWWGGNATNFKALWRQLFEQFRTAGVTNVIWLWASSDFCPSGVCSHASYYPGDDVVDMLGIDIYFDGAALPATAHTGLTILEGLGADKPIVIAELGPRARADFWMQAAAELGTIRRFRGFSLWFARGWKIWPAGHGSLVDGTLDTATRNAFNSFLTGVAQ